MTEYKTEKATVRIHGQPNRERIEQATVRFLKAVEMKKKKELAKK